MRIVQVIPAISLESSGPSYSVTRLCESVELQGASGTLAAMDFGHGDKLPSFAKVFPMGVGPKKLGRSPLLYQWLRDQSRSRQIDLIHNHGMWQMSAIYAAKVASRFKIPLVASPRGALSEWAMSHGAKKFKKLFWRLFQHAALLQADCLHATAMPEKNDIRRRRFRQPIAVIPNGIDVPDLIVSKKTSIRTLLFLGRIHQVKGLEVLLQAWRRVQDKHLDWQLSIVGSDQGYYTGQTGYLAQIQNLARELCLKRVEFVGEKLGQEKQQAYSNAELFVLPSYSENFGIAVAEALAAGTPAIVSKGAPWDGLELNDAGWHIEIGEEPLVECLNQALGQPSERLYEMGIAGRNWMQQDYSWQSVGRKMHETYRWLCDHRTDCPAWVHNDAEKDLLK